jgi:hypothetical protein
MNGVLIGEDGSITLVGKPITEPRLMLKAVKEIERQLTELQKTILKEEYGINLDKEEKIEEEKKEEKE